MTEKKQHRWRVCPVGEHWVKEHSRKVKRSEQNPDGITIVDGHYRKNSSRHEIFVADELHEIAKQHFKNLNEMPKADDLGSSRGNDFDELIGGWTQFWNDTFSPKEKLDPNIVKALVASESSFIANVMLKVVLEKQEVLFKLLSRQEKFLLTKRVS